MVGPTTPDQCGQNTAIVQQCTMYATYTFFHVQNTDRLRDEIHSLQTKLSEVSSTAIEQGERLREVRRAKRELDSDNNDLKTALKNAQVWL